MKNAFCLLLAFLTINCFSQEKERHKLESSLSFSFNTNGLAPIPAFSLNKPAIMAAANISKGRFSYDPVLAYSLKMKPWFIDNWLHYRIIDKTKFQLRAGVNFSTFCQEVTINGDDIVKAERYFALALSPVYKLSPTTSVILDYWSDNGLEKGSISGHFMSLSFDKSDVQLGKVLFSFNVMLFQLLYDGNNDGLFISPRFSLSVRNIPAALFFQATQEIRSNMTPTPGFRWNAGISYNL